MTNELPPAKQQIIDAQSFESMRIEEPPMTNVHEALAAASGESRAANEVMRNFSVRLPEQIKTQAQGICERHATDLGTYLRECAKALVRDYGGKVDEES